MRVSEIIKIAKVDREEKRDRTETWVVPTLRACIEEQNLAKDTDEPLVI